MMELSNLLVSKKTNILKKWFNEILRTYPADTSAFLKTDKDPFSNPVGQTILQGIEGIFDELLIGEGNERISQFLDNIIRIRAVQDFTASKALSFIFPLKKVIREELKNELNDRLSAELVILEDRIDNLFLISLDIFMQCREKIYEIKANEVKNMTFKLLQKAKLITEVPEQF